MSPLQLDHQPYIKLSLKATGQMRQDLTIMDYKSQSYLGPRQHYLQTL